MTVTIEENHDLPYVVGPGERVYRYAFAWEKPTLVIDADILPAAHHIRLVRILDGPLCRLVLKTLAKRLK